MIWWPTLTSFVAMALPTMPVPRTPIFMCILSFPLGFESPCDDLAVAQKFSGQILRGIERKPDGAVGALRNIALGVCAAHVGLDPARAHGVDRHRATQFGRENSGDRVQRC